MKMPAAFVTTLSIIFIGGSVLAQPEPAPSVQEVRVIRLDPAFENCKRA